MNNLQARIILKNRAECMQRVAKLGERCGRCSICPLHTSLDDYITAKRIADGVPSLLEPVYGEHTKAVLNSLYGEVKHDR